MDRGEIEFEVGEALKRLVTNSVQVPFSYALVPSKPKSDGGLGAGWNGWRLLLEQLVPQHLPQRRPYSALSIGVMLVEETFNKDLRSTRYRLTERLVLIDRHGL